MSESEPHIAFTEEQRREKHTHGDSKAYRARRKAAIERLCEVNTELLAVAKAVLLHIPGRFEHGSKIAEDLYAAIAKAEENFS
jgi:hypothetical protein